jgi:hypothetical protein
MNYESLVQTVKRFENSPDVRKEWLALWGSGVDVWERKGKVYAYQCSLCHKDHWRKGNEERAFAHIRNKIHKQNLTLARLAL